jgi:hypothetical protein
VDFVIIPHGVGVDYCTLWFGAFHAERRPEEMELHISSVGTPLPVPMQRWELIYPTDLLPGDGSNHYRQVMDCRGLEANHAYMLHLKRGSDVLASASIRTLQSSCPLCRKNPSQCCWDPVFARKTMCKEIPARVFVPSRHRTVPA